MVAVFLVWVGHHKRSAKLKSPEPRNLGRCWLQFMELLPEMGFSISHLALNKDNGSSVRADLDCTTSPHRELNLDSYVYSKQKGRHLRH